MAKIKLIKNEAAGAKQIIAYPPDFKKKHTLYVCPDTKANRKLIDDADVEYSIDTAADSDFITGMDKDGATGTVPYSKFLKNVKGAYSAVKAARESGDDSIGTTKFDIPEILLGFAGIDPTEMDDSDLEDLDSFLGYVWQDLRDICDEYVAHIKDGKVVGSDAYIRGHAAGDDFKVAALPGA